MSVEDEGVAKMVETLLWLRPSMPRAEAEEHVADLFAAVDETLPREPVCKHPHVVVDTDKATWRSQRRCTVCGETSPV